MSKRDPKRLPHDFHLWTSVAATVEPLRRRRLVKMPAGPLPLPGAENPPPAAAKAPPKRQPPRKPFLAPYQAPAPAAAPPDRQVDPSIRRKLGRGRIELDARIDLHGLTQAQARAALHNFIYDRFGRGDRTVLVITGKGVAGDNDYVAAMTQRGVLRTMLPIWLSEPALSPLVSGWSVAARGHGGEGAWYVRLRRA